MERWWEVVADCGRGCLTSTAQAAASRVVAAAKVVLADDLAPFEIEDVLSDFMKVVAAAYENRANETWWKTIGELATLLADVLPRYQNDMHNYMEDIVNLCMHGGYSAVVKRKAMQCLVALSCCSHAGPCLESVLPALLTLLRRNDDAITVRIPLSILIGSISDNHAELIQDPITVWRNYCAILEARKTSDTLASAVITGVTSFFNKFGREIPTADLNTFANTLLTDYIGKHQCQEAVLKLVSQHAALFRELLAGEVKYREAVWLGCGGSHAAAAAEATVAVYAAVGMAAAAGPLHQDLIWVEIFERSKPYAHIPNLFLRCAWAVVDACRASVEPDALARLEQHTDKVVSQIEFELECKVDDLADEPSDIRAYDNEAVKLMEKACWWVSRGEVGSERSLRCLLRLQHKCPSHSRKKLLAHPILNSGGGNGIIGFLINASCQTNESSKYLPLWRDLFDSKGGSDRAVTDNARQLFDDFVDCLLSVVGACLKNGGDGSGEKATTLLLLASSILSWEYVEDWLLESAESLLSATLDCQRALGATEGALSMMAVLTDAVYRHDDCRLSGELQARIERFYAGLSPVRCGSESVLVCVCRTLIMAPARLRKLSPDANVALQIIFSRKDVEPSLLSKALLCLQDIAASQVKQDKWFYEIKTRIEKLEKWKTWSGKDARILQRNICMFLGKFGTVTEENDNARSIQDVDDEEAVSKALTIKLSDPVTVSYELELSQLYEAAIQSEDSESLWAFLLMLCSRAGGYGGRELERTVARTVYALARCYSRGELPASKAPLMEQAAMRCARPAVVHDLFLKYIGEEKSPGVRKALSNILEQMLLRDPHSESSHELLSSLTEKAEAMLASECGSTKKAGLDIAEAITPALKGNNEFSKTRVSGLLLLILNTKDCDFRACYEPLAKYLEEHIVIFEKYELDTLATDSVKNLFSGEIADFTAIKMVIRKTLEINKVVRNYLRETDDVWKAFLEDLDEERTATRLYALAEARAVLDWDARTCMSVVSFEDFALVNAMLRVDGELRDDGATEFLMESMLTFLGEYADCLVECQYEKTSKILANVLTRQPPKMLKRLRSEIAECFQRYHIIWMNSIPGHIRDSYKSWFSRLPIKDISNKMKHQYADHGHRDVVSAIKITLDVLNSREVVESLQENKHLIKQWPNVILDLFENAHQMNRTKREFLTEALSVSLHFSSVAGLVDCVCRNVERCVNAFGEYMLREPEVLFDARLESVLSDVLRNLIKYAALEGFDEQKKSDLVELVDKLWCKLTTEPVRSLHGIMCALCLMRARPLGTDSHVARWLLAEMSSSRALGEKAMLMEMLACVVSSSDDDLMLVGAIKSYEKILPRLLSELSDRCSPRCFKAALSALAATKNPHLMRLVLTVSIGDKKSGWWDRDIEKCMEALANSSNIAEILIEHALKEHYPQHSRVLLMERLLVPLLQWSTSSFCEMFFSAHLEKMRSMLKSIPSELNTASGVFDAYLLNCIVAFNLARVMFEKVSAWSVESCDSPLYKSVRTEAAGRSWWLVRDFCAVCVQLRRKFPSPPSSEYARLFHCANYNCLAAAITKRGVFKTYSQLLEPEIWPLVVDCDKLITRWGPLECKPSTRRRRYNVSVPVEGEGEAGSRSTLSSHRSSSRTTLFLRSLSDNPLQYDLLNSDTETSGCQSVVLTSSELNDNECVATLSALLCHMAATQGASDADWTWRLAKALSSDHANVRATLAQIICNCKDDLRMHSEVFRSPLLGVTAQRPAHEPELNGLDVAVLDTIFFWAEQKPPTNIDHIESAFLSSCLQFLLEDLVSPRHTSNYVPKIILDKIEKLMKIFGEYVTLTWDDVWRTTVIDTNCNEFALKAWQKLTQVYIPNLVSLVADALDPDASRSLSNKMCELYGSAFAKCPSEYREESLTRFYEFANSVRKRNEADYVSVMYYAQIGSKEVCNEDNFRLIMGLASRMPHEPKKKCLKITSDYFSGVNVPTECIKDAFQVINISELLVGGDYSQYGLSMAMNGIRLMEEGTRRRVVNQALDYCGSAQEGVRKAAFQVLVAALDVILKMDEEPAAKRARGECLPSHTLLEMCRSRDPYERKVLAALAGGLIDDSDDIARLAYEGIERHMSERVGTRLAESVTAVLLLPSDGSCWPRAGSASRVRARHLSVAVRLVLGQIRTSDYFDPVTLRNSPLKKGIASAPRAFQASRLVTLSSRFQGSFRSGGGGRAASIGARRADATPEVAVAPYEDILKVFFDFAESDVEAARVLFKCSSEAIVGREGVREELSRLVRSLPACDATPALVDAFRMCAARLASNESFVTSVDALCELSRGSASEHLVELLREDLALNRAGGCELHFQWTHTEDVVAINEDKPFAIEGLLDASERMSNWDELTESQRRKATSSAAPLWTTNTDFQIKLDRYFEGGARESDSGSSAWLSRLYVAWKGEDGRRHNEWLRSARAWPGHIFTAAATVEAIEWYEVRNGTRDWSEVCGGRLDLDATNMAHTAALLMFRSLLCQPAHADGGEGLQDEKCKSLRAREADWIRVAFARAAYGQVLACVDRNQSALYRSEIIPWKLSQLRSRLELSPHPHCVQEILNQAEPILASYRDCTKPDEVLEMSEFLVMLSGEVGASEAPVYSDVERTIRKMSGICEEMRAVYEKDVRGGGHTSARALLRAHRTAAIYCEGALDSHHAPETRYSLFESMSDSVLSCVQYDSSNSCSAVVSMLLRRLLSEDHDVVATILAKLGRVANRLDSVTLEVIRRMREREWRNIPITQPLLDVLAENIEREMWSRCLASLRDPSHALKSLCQQIYDALIEKDRRKLTPLLKELSDNTASPNTGVAYQILEPHHAKLRTLLDIDICSKTATDAATKLVSDTMRQLGQTRNSMPLADVCPPLSLYPQGASERDRLCLDGLLGVGGGVRVVKFDRQLAVMSSLRRPVRVRALLSDGRTRTYLVKAGEDVRNDASCQRVQAFINRIVGRDDIYTYKVTPLGSSAGLIEFLDRFQTARSLMGRGGVDLDQLRSTSTRPEQDLSQLARPENVERSLRLHRDMVSRAPPTLLRSAIEAECRSVEEFMRARRIYLRCLTAMTISHWLLGVGDRHLENLMVEARSGTLCGIDWGSLWDGLGLTSIPELQPARLTRSLLAVHLRSLTILESGMQKMMRVLRAEWRTLYAACCLAFHWQPEYETDPFQNKLLRLKCKLSGAALSFHATSEALGESALRDSVVFRAAVLRVKCPWPVKDIYSVEDQVSALLRQCTSEELLAVSRSGWEPWL